jgi:integrase
LPSGRWTVQVPLGTDPGGKRLRPRVSGATPEEVREKRDALLARHAAGLLSADPTADRQTVAALLRSWLDNKDGTVTFSTWDRYQLCVERHLIPLLGNVRIGVLTPNDVRRAYRQLQAPRPAGGGLSGRSVAYAHITLKQALRQAVQDGALARNVADAVSPPSSRAQEARALTTEEARALLEQAEGRWRLLWLLALYTGMRQGELFGLTWPDVSLTHPGGATVTVRRARVKVTSTTYVTRPSPKSRAGVRVIPLPQQVVEALSRHRAHQLEARVRAGPLWADTEQRVFLTSRGTSPSGSGTIDALHRHAAQAGIPGTIGLHCLRHTFASSLLAAGRPVTEVSYLLGHASPATTLKIYSHWVRGAEASTADVLSRYYAT